MDVTPEKSGPAGGYPIEPKVRWAATAAWLVGLVAMTLWNAATGNGNELLVAALPDALEVVVLPLIPAIGSLVAGYAAAHQYRASEVHSDQRVQRPTFTDPTERPAGGLL